MSMPNVGNPIKNYSDLKQAISLWIDRDDDEFVNQIPNFINFAEKEIYRNLIIPAFEKEVELNIDDGVAYIPSDLLEVRYIFNQNGKFFRATSVDEIDMLISNNTSNTTNFNHDEVVFARLTGRYIFYPAITDTVILGYRADQIELADDADTNTLLTIAPELLLYYALRHACTFVQDDEGFQRWSLMGKNTLDEIVSQNARMEYSGSPLVIPNVVGNITSNARFGYYKFRR